MGQNEALSIGNEFRRLKVNKNELATVNLKRSIETLQSKALRIDFILDDGLDDCEQLNR